MRRIDIRWGDSADSSITTTAAPLFTSPTLAFGSDLVRVPDRGTPRQWSIVTGMAFAGLDALDVVTLELLVNVGVGQTMVELVMPVFPLVPTPFPWIPAASLVVRARWQLTSTAGRIHEVRATVSAIAAPTVPFNEAETRDEAFK